MDHRKRFDIQRLRIGFIKNFFSGFQFRPRKDFKLLKQLYGLICCQGIDCIDHGYEIG